MKDLGPCMSWSPQSTWKIDMTDLTFWENGTLLCRNQTCNELSRLINHQILSNKLKIFMPKINNRSNYKLQVINS